MVRTLILLQLLTVSPREAHEAERLVHESMREYDLAEFDQALTDATQAYKLDPVPAILFNLGQCHRALRHWDKAAFFFRRYLDKLPNAPNRRLASELLAEADARANAQGVAASRPTALPSPPSSEVLVLAPASEAPQKQLQGSFGPAVPPAAIGVEGRASAPAARHSHLLGIGLLAGGILAAGVATVAEVEVQSYLANRSAVHSPTTGTFSALDLQRQTVQNGWFPTAIVLGLVAAAGFTGAALTW